MRAHLGLLVSLALLSGCIEAALVACDDGTLCPVGSSCVAGGGCTSPQQELACAGRSDGDACALQGLGDGICTGGLCVLAVCGNGRTEGLEACDDGNNVSGDGCSASCDSSELCGNGLVDIGEDCDLGAENTMAPDAGCRPGCVRPACGDEVVDVARGELCDDGAANASTPDAPCRPDCRPRRCGDGIVDPLAAEVCDDGNLAVGDGCTPDCASNERCGNGVFDFFAGEQCDDGNLQSHDLCSSACTREEPVFELQGRQPGPRYAAPLAYDRARDRVVLFGGYATNGVFARDTWEWDGVAWTERSPSRRPPARHSAAMAYDARRNRTILFGGFGLDATGVVNLADTWEWDGVNWELSAATGPAASPRVAMTYDSTAEHAVLIDGSATWAYDGTWSQLAASSPPSPIAMSYAPGIGLVAVSYGGATWVYAGSWTQVADLADVAASEGALPGLTFDEGRGQVVARGYRASYAFDGAAWSWLGDLDNRTVFGPALVYEARRARLMMFGGNDDFFANPFFIHRLFVGGSWEAWSQPASPTMRAGAAMAYDPLRGRSVLFGGGTSTQTWEWNGSVWNLVVPQTTSPPARTSGMAYDPATRSALLVNDLGQTWTWDGSDWTLHSPATSPPPRYTPRLATDPTAPRVLLFGGEDATSFRADTWLWDGTTWTEVVSAQTPGGRAEPALATDSHRQRVVLFGGYVTDGNGFSSTYQDTWEWDGAAWTRRYPDAEPPGRSGHVLAYDPLSRATLMFGGVRNEQSAHLGDVWRWDGDTWISLQVAGGPSARASAGGAFHTAGAELLLFGGSVFSTRLGDTWTLRYDGATVDEACFSAEDIDRDGLVGCADADCGARCQPLCLPALEDVGVCTASDDPHCGDGSCSVWLENCALCPGDCGACP